MKALYLYSIIIFLSTFISSRKNKKPHTQVSISGTKRKSKKRALISDVQGIPDDFQLTDEFSNAFELMENSHQHLFVTGNAGTGKSTLLQYFKKNTRKNYIVVAPTGIAAINVGGSTIHSFFRFPTHVLTSDDVSVIRDKEALFASLETIVIDEVSMVRADIMDAIDYSLRMNREKPNDPFGGVQMILIGDLHQLPPIVEPELHEYFRDNFQSPFFFSANVFKQVPLKKIELKRIFRQTDSDFIGLLNNIRNKKISHEDFDRLNAQFDSTAAGDDDDLAITLTGTNALASAINQSRLDSIRKREYYYDAEVTGTFDEKSFPTDKHFRLKPGAQIMMVKNDPNKQWVNGSLGIVKKLSENSIKVFFGDHSCDIEPTIWEKIEYAYNPEERNIESIVVGSFRQYPIKLAWAITIHKSQGKTFDKVIIDLGHGAFAHGQAYVALSRCRTLSGIRLRKPIRYSDVMLDDRVVDFQSSSSVEGDESSA